MPNSITSFVATNEYGFRIIHEEATSDHMEGAIALWKANRNTLGLFPRGAFEEYARNKLILYLLVEGEVKGYLLYRFAKQRVAISHLCVSDELRGKGGARTLFEELKQTVDDGFCKGIEVRCRSDYEISRMWPSLGFECAGYIQGKAKSGSELTIWFFKFDVSDFFYEMMPRPEDDELAWAVLDANIVFKLSAPSESDNEEACALLSETFLPYVRYFVTPEVFVETDRKKKAKEKKRSIDFAKKFERIEVKRSSFEYYRDELLVLWAGKLNDRDRSDLHHIAYSAASGFRYFITQDTGILEKAEKVNEVANISILRPVDFITQLDQIENRKRYTPRSISRTNYRSQCPTNEQITTIAEHFCIPSKGEKRKVLEAKLRTAIANKDQYETLLITSNDKQNVALVCVKRHEQQLTIEIMRHSGDLTSKTISQNLAWNKIFSDFSGQLSLIKYKDEYSANQNDELFQANGFISTKGGWLRISGNISSSLFEAKKIIGDFVLENTEIDKPIRDRLLTFIRSGCDPSELEEAFWPLKITDSEIPTYLIPIKPVWALHLFDEGLAEKDLWGADPTKHFNIENVYYRSPKPFKMVPGARILWYVSSQGRHKVSEIRACSRLVSSEIDTAKSLYKKYKRLGIYEWSNLMEITDNDAYGQVMALRFYQTEYFRTPIELSEFSKYDINGQPFSPKNITNHQFNKIYSAGMK
tara:strand:+ start:1088 stop:3187 length:2100 start_codon:yes stop_codon:yes gene_type:complete